jgi:hypothetical protein
MLPQYELRIDHRASTFPRAFWALRSLSPSFSELNPASGGIEPCAFAGRWPQPHMEADRDEIFVMIRIDMRVGSYAFLRKIWQLVFDC